MVVSGAALMWPRRWRWAPDSFVGRPFGYAAAVGSEAGVLRAMELLAQELRRNVAMLGLTRIVDVNKEYLRAVAPGTGLQRYLDA
ncbi:FMN-dependent dehydrogenase [Pollutimonas bauzanensis]|uniref:FMN-dependent dehydrogenase n=1 Tax=Pollutimonas bauzanensis TaxID=658167 RepID=A0A1M5ZTG0_9BURK|nr:FMN-dependent dehydrogenase [Pollutimonas bauzanensis]